MSTHGVDPERPRCPGCQQTQVTAGQLTCPTCWAKIPRSLRHAVREAHTYWVGDPTDHHWSIYMRARRDALEALND